MSNPHPRRAAVLWVLAACVALSTAPAAVKAALNVGDDPTALVALRNAVGAVALWLVVGARRPELLVVSRRGWCWCCAAGVANALSMLGYYVGLREVELSLATLLFAAYPAAVLLLLWLGGERATATSVVRLALALGGVALLAGGVGVGGVGEASVRGVLLVVAATFVFALHLNLVQWRLRGIPAMTVTVHVVTAMAACLLAAWWLAPTGAAGRWPSALGWGVVAWTGLVATAFARYAMFLGIQRLGSGQTALLGPIETLCTVAWAVLLFGDAMDWRRWAGGALVLLSALLRQSGRQGPSTTGGTAATGTTGATTPASVELAGAP